MSQYFATLHVAVDTSEQFTEEIRPVVDQNHFRNSIFQYSVLQIVFLVGPSISNAHLLKGFLGVVVISMGALRQGLEF